MSQKDKTNSSDEPAVKIDYDNVDVARIMDEIRKKIARKPGREGGDPDERGVLDTGTQLAHRSGIKSVLLKIMSPFAPLIKLLILPVYEEHRQMVLILDQANRKLDRAQEYINLTHNLCHNLVVELTKLKIEVDLLKTKVQIMEKDFEFLGKKEKVLEKEIFK